MDAMFDSLHHLLTGSASSTGSGAHWICSQLLRDVRDSLQVRIGERATDIRIPKPLPTVACDPVRTAASSNLIANALKYIDNAGALL
jgi:light-regulated signal transduction histidine kinase (bacteriophytochrome)